MRARSCNGTKVSGASFCRPTLVDRDAAESLQPSGSMRLTQSAKKREKADERIEAKFEFWRRWAILVCRENFSRQYRGSDWVVLALGYRLALGVAISIFFLRARVNSQLKSLAKATFLFAHSC